MCKIIRNVSIMRHRTNTAMKRNSSFEVAMSKIEHCIASPETVEGALEAKSLARIIECFLDTLTEENRVIFMRRYWFSDSYADISNLTGLTKQTSLSIKDSSASCMEDTQRVLVLGQIRFSFTIWAASRSAFIIIMFFFIASSFPSVLLWDKLSHGIIIILMID